eukprot:m.52890 g.52890  ORF g.52890 m.52890 type:complete len:353 (-) comp18321_c0_seq2:63-1121(-)
MLLGKAITLPDLLQQGLDPNSQFANWSLLNWVCAYNHARLFKAFLDLPNINLLQKNRDGKTPLHIGAVNGQVEFVKQLLARGVNVNCVDDELRTPLHCAVEGSQSHIVSHLLEAGANLEAQDFRKCTPLHIAWRDPFLVSMLVRMGADVNIRDKSSRTILQKLCTSSLATDDLADAIETLLQHGARVQRSPGTRSPLQAFAQDCRDFYRNANKSAVKKIIKLLLLAGDDFRHACKLPRMYVRAPKCALQRICETNDSAFLHFLLLNGYHPTFHEFTKKMHAVRQNFLESPWSVDNRHQLVGWKWQETFQTLLLCMTRLCQEGKIAWLPTEIVWHVGSYIQVGKLRSVVGSAG